MRTKFPPAAAAAILVLAGCTSHVRYPFDARAVPVAGAPPMAAFDYQRTPGAARLGDALESRPGYLTRRFTMTASFANGQPRNRLTGMYHASAAAGAKPLVIVLPVWGVSEYPSIKMTDALLDRSSGAMNVLRIDGERRLMPWRRIGRSSTAEEFASGLSEAALRLRHAVVDVRRMIDWAEGRPEVDDRRIGLVGFSISAVIGTLAVQSDRRIRAGALVMGGAEIARIVSQCPGNEKDTREAIMAGLGLDRNEYERTIEAAFQGLDPADYPGRVDPAGVLVVDAARDDCIPPQSREAWWRALGKPERISMNYSHRGAFLAMTPLGFNFLRREVYRHLAERL